MRTIYPSLPSLTRRRALVLAGAAAAAVPLTLATGRAAIAGYVAGPPPRREAAPIDLVIERGKVVIDGAPRGAITINGTLPGPILHWREGDRAIINVTNRLDEPTSIHWHGLLLPGPMDGAPGFNGFRAIVPGDTRTYDFTLRQSGTYWYHSHSAGQEQEGLYGAIVIDPAKPDMVKYDREHVVVLSDHSDQSPDTILRNLKVSEGHYNRGRRALGDLIDDASRDGLGAALSDRMDWAAMRMDATDLTDVTGYRFLVNGRGAEEAGHVWLATGRAGEKVRLRIINAAAMSILDVSIPGLPMTVVAADGRNVRPTRVDEFRFGPGETYDVVVTPQADRAYSLVAEPLDRSGFARATLSPREGVTGPMPPHRPRTTLTMDDMGMMEGMDHSGMAGMDHGAMDHGSMGGMAGMGGMPGMDHSTMDHSAMGHGDMGAPRPPTHARGWADAGTMPGARALTPADLVASDPDTDTREPNHEITLRLTGMMGRYIWTLNGDRFDESEPIRVSNGDRVRIRFVNETMMAHPMHLHGMFMRLENGRGADAPARHTVLVPPGKTVSVRFTADEPGEWPLHCHLLYHMASGMMTRFVVETRAAAL